MLTTESLCFNDNVTLMLKKHQHLKSRQKRLKKATGIRHQHRHIPKLNRNDNEMLANTLRTENSGPESIRHQARVLEPISRPPFIHFRVWVTVPCFGFCFRGL